MKKVIGVLLVAVAVVLVVQGAGWGNIPMKMNIQGKLLKDGKAPKTLSQVNIAFGDSGGFNPAVIVTGTNLVYQPETGVFSAIADISAQTNKLNSYTSKVIITVVGTGSDSAPFTQNLGEQPLASVPYAYRASAADSVTWPQEKTLNNTTGPLLKLENTTPVSNYQAAATFTGNFVGALGVANDGAGIIGVGSKASLVADANLGIPYLGYYAGVNGRGANIPGVAASSTNHYGLYAVTESTNKPGILAIGAKAGIEGRDAADAYNFGMLGATFPNRTEGVFPMYTGNPIQNAGAYGQVEKGSTYGYLGYSYRTSPTDTTPTLYGVVGVGPTAAWLMSSDKNKYALVIDAKGWGLNLTGGKSESVGGYLAYMKQESTYAGAGGLEVINDGGGTAGRFDNTSNGFAGYFTGKDTTGGSTDNSRGVLLAKNTAGGDSVVGISTGGGEGVSGYSASGYGIEGTSGNLNSGAGVYGKCTATNGGTGLLGDGYWGGRFIGGIKVEKGWAGSVNIDAGAINTRSDTGNYYTVFWRSETGDLYKNTSPSYTSSKRYKKDISLLKDDFSKILKISPKTFTWKKEGTQDMGFIAEDLDEAGLKKLVIYNKQGQPDGIQYEKIQLYLLEVIKELKVQNDKLEARVKALENK